MILRHPVGGNTDRHTDHFPEMETVVQFMKVLAPSLNPIFRSDTQGRLLARLLLDPETEFTITELSHHVGCSAPTVLREVERAELAGLVRTRKIGPSRMVRTDDRHR